MSDFEQFQELITASIVITIISIVLTLAWMSTYVRDQPIIATVVVLQQETTTMNDSREHTESPQPRVPSREQPEETNLQQPADIFLNEPVNIDISNNHEVPSRLLSDQNVDEADKPSIVLNETIANHSSKNNFLENQIPCSNEYESEFISRPPMANLEHKSTDEGNVCTSNESINFQSTDSILRNRKMESNVSRSTEIINSEKEQQLARERDMNTTIIDDAVTNDSESIPPGSIRIRLKFLDDTQRLVKGQLSELVGNFKRANFEIELSTNCAIRLIFNGKLLNKDSSTLNQYGLFDNCVVHCYVGQPQPHPTVETSLNNANTESDDIDLSEILSPLLLIVVVLLWYLRYEYSHIFNTSATVILVCLTALLLISQYALTITFNISMAFNNSVSGVRQAGNRDDSVGNSPSSFQASMDSSSVDDAGAGAVREAEEQHNVDAAGAEQSIAANRSVHPSNENDLSDMNTNQKTSPNISALKDFKLQKRGICGSNQENSFSNSNLVSSVS